MTERWGVDVFVWPVAHLTVLHRRSSLRCFRYAPMAQDSKPARASLAAVAPENADVYHVSNFGHQKGDQSRVVPRFLTGANGQDDDGLGVAIPAIHSPLVSGAILVVCSPWWWIDLRSVHRCSARYTWEA